MPGSLRFPEGFKGGVLGSGVDIPINTKVLSCLVPVTKEGRLLVSGKVLPHGRGVTPLFTVISTPTGLTLENFSTERVLNPDPVVLSDDMNHEIRILVSTSSGDEEKIIVATGWRR